MQSYLLNQHQILIISYTLMPVNQAGELMMILIAKVGEGRWSDDEIHYHINVLELLAIELALKPFKRIQTKSMSGFFLAAPLQ